MPRPSPASPSNPPHPIGEGLADGAGTTGAQEPWTAVGLAAGVRAVRTGLGTGTGVRAVRTGLGVATGARSVGKALGLVVGVRAPDTPLGTGEGVGSALGAPAGQGDAGAVGRFVVLGTGLADGDGARLREASAAA